MTLATVTTDRSRFMGPPSRTFPDPRGSLSQHPPPRNQAPLVRPSGTRSVRRACPLTLAQFDAPDLAGEGLRQVGHELDEARVGVGGVAVAYEGLDLLFQGVRGLI